MGEGRKPGETPPETNPNEERLEFIHKFQQMYEEGVRRNYFADPERVKQRITQSLPQEPIPSVTIDVSVLAALKIVEMCGTDETKFDQTVRHARVAYSKLKKEGLI